ncbi:CpsD/CapB family tyrosine-protein kinase [Bacillus cereus]|uniref:non-specific protein-tyrosine kinase n=1 Tax=Bacillus cereus VD184 TaxID=1053242 RepID=A0A9W5VS85_BACCE|nr:CpsD/CapB family tyrosine-protein kinase [Bacillus cereus]EOQ11110.1 capsular exopolysaccharide family protein [Bacillus cereus VD184]
MFKGQFFKKKNQTTQRRKLITHSNPKSPIAEQFRNIRTNIEFASIDKKIRSLVVTSANPSEGKTVTTSNLAVVFAQQGKNVLLIDGDLRKPVLHQMLQVDNIFGLTNMLTHNQTLHECIHKTDIPHLDFISCGTIPPNPAELLSSNNMKNLLSQIYSIYDLVIFDLPPILPVSDAQIMANQCDASILVLRSSKTEKSAALKAKKLLESANGKLLGAVLNDHGTTESAYYYYGEN